MWEIKEREKNEVWFCNGKSFCVKVGVVGEGTERTRGKGEGEEFEEEFERSEKRECDVECVVC